MKEQKKPDIIFFALARFDGPYSSTSISLAKEFAKDHRVFYINHPYSVKDIFSNYKSDKIGRKLPALFFGKGRYQEFEGRNQGQKVTMVTPPLTLPVNFLPPGKLYSFFQKFNDRVFFSALRRLIRDKGIQNFIFLNAYNPYFGINFPSDIQPALKIYQCLDDMEEDEYTKKHGARLEKKMMAAYDLTLTSSEELLRLNKPYAKNIRYLPNAADAALFNQAYERELPTPSEFAGETEKVIGYIGNIEQRMDYELVKKIATAHADKKIYLVGPTSSNEYLESGLNQIDNIVFTGGKRIEELPAYLQNFDCAIIPFRCNKLTRSIYPLKINEYLAGGKPVVTTNFSSAISDFKRVVYLAQDHNHFVDLITTALDEDNAELARMRVQYAARNTWENRVKDFWKLVAELKDAATA